MASATETETELKCPICFEYFDKPRKLSGCVHCFCENCIFSYVLNLKKEDKLGQEFECPVCRSSSKSPENGDVTLDWVRQMEKPRDEEAVVEEKTDAHKLCSQCKYVNKNVKSEVYCLNCHESFCCACSETLHGFKINNDHTIVDTGDEESAKTHMQAFDMLRSFLRCPQHPGEDVKYVCDDSKNLLCGLCVVSYNNNYKNTKQIRTLTSQASDDWQARLIGTVTDSIKHIQEIVGIIKGNYTENTQKLKTIRCEFQDLKNKIVRVLEAMEESLMEEGNAIVKEVSIKHLDEIQGLEQISSKLEGLQYILEKMAKNLSPLQVNVCIHEANRVLREALATLAAKWSCRKAVTISFETADALDTVLETGINETSKLGSIRKTESTVILPGFESSTLVRQAKVTKEKVYRIQPVLGIWTDPTYNCLFFLTNGNIFIVDSFYGFCILTNRNKNVTGFYHKDYKPMENKKYLGNLRHATYLGNNLIAISIAHEKKICLVNCEENFEKSIEITCKYTPKALHSLRNGDLAISWDDPLAFGIMSFPPWSHDQNIYFTVDKSGRKFKSFDFMAVDEDRRHVVQPCTVDKAVYCFDFNGEPVFKYTHSELQHPRGVAVDSEGRIYVCEMEKCCIQILSPHGCVIKVISKNDGCPEKPFAIGIDCNTLGFAVTTYAGPWDYVHFFSLVEE